MDLDNQTPWKIGPIPARLINSPDGKTQYMANIEAPISLVDAVIKFWPDGDRGPCFVLENRRNTPVANKR